MGGAVERSSSSGPRNGLAEGAGEIAPLNAKENFEGRPHRVQRKRSKGWKMPPNTVYVGRPGRFGNPFHVGQDGTHEQCVNLHRRWLDGSLSDQEIQSSQISINAEWLINMRHPRLGAILRELPGKNLACWCGPGPCHADVLLELANK